MWGRTRVWLTVIDNADGADAKHRLLSSIADVALPGEDGAHRVALSDSGPAGYLPRGICLAACLIRLRR
jgi:hypothetical protein